MDTLKRNENETYVSFLKRIVNLTKEKTISYSEMGDYLLGDKNVYGSENLRKAFYILSKIVDNIEDDCVVTDNDLIRLLEEKKRETEKERIKLQTTKLEYAKWLREEARDELILEEIKKSIAALPPLEVPEYIEPVRNTKGYALLFGDEHYGVSFEIKDLFGNIINEYSPEIFEERMWTLLNKTIYLINKENINVLHVLNMGDFSDGCLRVSQLMKLRYGVIDGSIMYANFMIKWLNELSKYAIIKFHMTDGNHTELRMLGQKKGTFTEDNMGKVVREMIKLGLKDNPNFTLIENPTGYIYAQIACHTILGIHGETKNMENTLKDFSRIYNIDINYLIAGHLHHGKAEEVGINASVINIPSVIGTDPYALSLQKVSNPSAKLLEFDQLDGLVCEHTLVL